MLFTDSWSDPYDVIAASEPNRLPACLSLCGTFTSECVRESVLKIDQYLIKLY